MIPERVTGAARRLRGLGGVLDTPASRLIARNAGSLVGTTAVTALLGYGFWGLAARLASQAEVGAAAAAISAMQLIATVASLGLGTFLMAVLGGLRQQRHQIVVTCLWLAGVASAVLAAAYALALGVLDSASGALYETWDGVALFAVGTGVTAAVVVLDGALIGVLQGGRQLARNTVFSVIKLALVPLCLVVGWARRRRCSCGGWWATWCRSATCWSGPHTPCSGCGPDRPPATCGGWAGPRPVITG